jgi:hypothetical protein
MPGIVDLIGYVDLGHLEQCGNLDIERLQAKNIRAVITDDANLYLSP